MTTVMRGRAEEVARVAQPVAPSGDPKSLKKPKDVK